MTGREKEVVVSRVDVLAPLEIAAQGACDGWMQRQQTGFSKFRVANLQHAVWKDIIKLELKCLGYSKPRRGDEPDQCAVHRAAQTVRVAKSTCRGQEAHHFFGCVDVGQGADLGVVEQSGRWYFVDRILGVEEARQMAHALQSDIPGIRR